MIYCISDTHFSHKNIIKYCDRPFAGTEEMNETIIERWNRFIGPKDIVYHLGDVVLTKEEEAYDIIARLGGQKYLIRGNHDKRITTASFKKMGFIEVYNNSLILKEQGVILSHVPILSTSGLFNVHGHTHNTDPSVKYVFYSKETHRCVSVELINYQPISLELILEEVRNGGKKEGC